MDRNVIWLVLKEAWREVVEMRLCGDSHSHARLPLCDMHNMHFSYIISPPVFGHIKGGCGSRGRAVLKALRVLIYLKNTWHVCFFSAGSGTTGYENEFAEEDTTPQLDYTSAYGQQTLTAAGQYIKTHHQTVWIYRYRLCRSFGSS